VVLLDSAMRVLFVEKLLGNLNFQPLGLLSLAASAKRAGHEVRLADLSKPGRVLRSTLDFRPDVIGFPVVTGQHLGVLDMCRRLKSRLDFRSVFGGPHATFFPAIAQRDEVDAVLVGEGERSFVDFLDSLREGGDGRKTPNFAFGNAEGFDQNPLAPLIEDLDGLPFGAWEILDEHPVAARFPARPFMASRGCPFQCRFCYNPRLREMYRGKGRFLRRFSPERFVAEVAAYKKRAPLSFVYIFDDTFAEDPQWLQDFSRRYRREVNLPFFVNFTAGLVTPERISLLADAGLSFVGIGLESGDEEVRSRVLGKRETDEQMSRASSVLREAGVAFEFFNMLGLPGTTLDSDLATLSMNVKLRPTFPEVTVFQPYPGTPLGDEAARRGLFSGDPDDIPPTFKGITLLPVADAKKFRRLFLLFRPLVAARSSKRLAQVLIALPLTPLYWLINRLHEGWVKSRGIYKIRLRLRDYPVVLYRYLTS